MTPLSSLADHERERRFIRRGVVVVAAAALLSAPLANLGPLTGQSWVLPVNLALLAGILAGTRIARLPISRVIALVAIGMHLVAVAVYVTALHAHAAGTGGPGLGSAALWVTAVATPVTHVVLSGRQALTLSVTGLAGFAAATTIPLGAQGWRLAAAHGGVEAMLLALVCLAVVAVVAARARRLAGLGQTAREEAAEAATRLERLGEQSQQRRADLAAAAAGLVNDAKALADQVHRLVPALRANAGSTRSADLLGDVAATVEHLREGASRTLDAQGRGLDAPATNGLAVRATAGSGAAPSGFGGLRVPLPSARTFAVMGAGLVAWLLLADAYELHRLLAAPALDQAAMARSANRMVLLLVVASSAAALLLPRRWAVTAVVAAALVHPMAVLLDRAAHPGLATALQRLVPAWRIGILGALLLLLLGSLCAMRAHVQAQARMARSADLVAADALLAESWRHQQESAEVAHEVQTPVAVLHGSVQTLQRHLERVGGETLEELTDGMLRAVARIVARAEALLAAATSRPLLVERTGADRTPLTQPARDVLLDAIRASQPALGGHEVDIHLELHGAVVQVAPDDLEHVLENLLSNARKYGDPARSVTLEARRHEGDVEVEVTNGGGGLSSEDATRVFEPYFRSLHVATSIQGTGLGLAVVRRLVEGWGGRVWCRAGDDRTSVGFTIPLAGSRVRTRADAVR